MGGGSQRHMILLIFERISAWLCFLEYEFYCGCVRVMNLKKLFYKKCF
jgi:hypothetical protein